MLFTHGHALLIGVGTYQQAPHLNIPITVADVQEVAAVLRHPQYCGYPPKQVTLLHDTTATRDGILSVLDDLAAHITTADTVLLFYSGHGAASDDGHYYLTAHDTRFVNGKVVSGTGVSDLELLDKLRKIGAKRMLLIFNACHSGTVSPTLDAEASFTGQSLPDQTAAALLATGEGRVIMTSCRENQYAYVGTGEQTIFAQALLDGLHGKGMTSRGGYISVFDLYSYVYFQVGEMVEKQVSAAVRKQYGGTQEPELTVLKGIGPLAVALYHGATTLGDIVAPAHPADGTSFREVSTAVSRATLQQVMRIGGDVVGNDNITAQGGKGLLNRPTGPVQQIFGDQRNINTGGGDYAEGNIDKRRGSFAHGDQFALTGNFQGAILNMKSQLSQVSQSINELPNADSQLKEELKQLIEQLSAELQKAPPDKIVDAEAVTEIAKQLVETATKEQPNRTLVQISVEGLKKAAENIASVLPAVLPIATQIATHILKLTGAL